MEVVYRQVEEVAFRLGVGVAWRRLLGVVYRQVEEVAYRLGVEVAWRHPLEVVYRREVGAASRHQEVVDYRQKVVLHQVAVVCLDQAAELQQNLLLKQPRMPKLVLTIS